MLEIEGLGYFSFNGSKGPATMEDLTNNNSDFSLDSMLCGGSNITNCGNGTRSGEPNDTRPPLRPELVSLEDQGSMNPYTLLVYGYISPNLVLLTIITNSLVSVVLLRKNMRTPTNTLLVAMAISDMLTGIWSVPCFIYFYQMGNYKEWVPYNWCFVYFLLTDYLPTIFHTASIWLTVALAVQRYIYVCHSLKAKQWCTIPNVLKCVAIIYGISVMAHLCRFVETEYKPEMIPSRLDPNVTVSACSNRFRPFVEAHQNIIFNVYFWFRVIFIHFVPCTSLVVLNALLILAMRAAQRRRKQLLKQNRRSESRNLKESNCTTLMLVAVVGVFLLVELPLGIYFIIMILDNTFELMIVNGEAAAIANMFINLFILLSYPLNFFIYCGMSRQFRETFKRLFVPGTTPLNREHSNYCSLATENGAKFCTTTETVM